MGFPLLVAVSSLVLLSSTIRASEFDFGVGIGPQYSGLGVSSKYFTSDSAAFGLSAGCLSFSSVIGNSCGLGISYERTDLISADSNQHAFGVYLGITGEQNVKRDSFDRENVYGGGLFYTYYLNELSESGFHLGAHIVAENQKSGTHVRFGLNLGYRF